MSIKSLKETYKNIFEQEEDLTNLDQEEKERIGPDHSSSIDRETLVRSSEKVTFSDKGFWNFKISNKLDLGKDIAGTGKNIKFDLKDIENFSSQNIIELQNSLFLRMLWESASNESTGSVLSSYNASSFGDISERFFRIILGISGKLTVDLNDILAAGNTEFADVYSVDDNCSWSLKMARNIGDQKISMYKIHSAFYQNRNLSETKAGVMWLQAYGDGKDDTKLILHVYGPTSYEEINNKRVSLRYEINNIISSESFKQEDDTTIIKVKTIEDLYNEVINFKIIPEAIATRDDKTKNDKQKRKNNSHFYVIWKAIMSKLIDSIDVSLDEKLKAGLESFYNKATKTTISKALLGLEGLDDDIFKKKVSKTSFREFDLEYFFNTYTKHEIIIPSAEEINKCINRCYKKTKRFQDHVPDEFKQKIEDDKANWMNHIFSSLMSRNKSINVDLLKMFPFLKTYHGSEMTKSKRTADNWSDFAGDIEQNEEEGLKSFRKGWNDLRDVIDNTLKYDQNKSAVDKGEKLDKIGKYLQSKARDIDNLDNEEDLKVNLNKMDFIRKSPQAQSRITQSYDRLTSKNVLLGEDRNISTSKNKKLLKEAYSDLFKKKLINEGGLAGHMMHPYEALDMTPRQIIDRIKEYSTSQSIIEKVDGQNLFFTIEQDGTLMFARNKEDMTHDDLVAKFTGHGAEKPFIEGGNAIKNGVKQWLQSAGDAAEMEIREIFHPLDEIKSFINFEIMHPEKENQIIYDEKYIVFHSIIDYVDGRKTIYSTNKGQRLEKLIRLIESGVTASGFTLASNRTVNLNELTNVQIEEYAKRIKEISQQLDITEVESIGDGIEKQIKKEIDKEGINISDEAIQILYDFALYGESKSGDKIKSKDFTSLMSKEDTVKLRSIGLTSATKALKKVQHIISPYKGVFVDLGIDLLRGVKSAYMSDKTNQMNIELLKEKLKTAIDDLVNYMEEVPEESWEPIAHRLQPHLDKVMNKGIDLIVSTSVEGGVYDYQGDLIKVTGGFAPLNQILGAAYRDNKGIFVNFKAKYKKNESRERSLKDAYKMLF